MVCVIPLGILPPRDAITLWCLHCFCVLFRVPLGFYSFYSFHLRDYYLLKMVDLQHLNCYSLGRGLVGLPSPSRSGCPLFFMVMISHESASSRASVKIQLYFFLVLPLLCTLIFMFTRPRGSLVCAASHFAAANVHRPRGCRLDWHWSPCLPWMPCETQTRNENRFCHQQHHIFDIFVI